MINRKNIRYSFILLITILLGCGKQGKDDLVEHNEGIELAGYTIGQKLHSIQECSGITPDYIGEKKFYYCELHNAGKSMEGQKVDELLLRFNGQKVLSQINIGVYGEEKILALLEDKFGEFEKKTSWTGSEQYYFYKDSIRISYETVYSTPGSKVQTSAKSEGNIKKHAITIDVMEYY